uniref:Homeobox domain-containing protein n=1 Tax=Globodera rostochiensis TaxID=31243 RepID=A0A914H7M4_GLORO
MRFSRDQLNMLERAFQKTHYPDCFERENLGAGIGVAEWQLTRWFQNRRAKDRRIYKEAAQLLFQHNEYTLLLQRLLLLFVAQKVPNVVPSVGQGPSSCSDCSRQNHSTGSRRQSQKPSWHFAHESGGRRCRQINFERLRCREYRRQNMINWKIILN